jgi:hypothetical protein
MADGASWILQGVAVTVEVAGGGIGSGDIGRGGTGQRHTEG